MANAHSLYRFAGTRFHAVGATLYRANVVLITGGVFDGTPLRYVRMPPTLETDISEIQIADHLFVAGGGALRKVNVAGAVSLWGIEAPPDGFTAVAQAAANKVIDAFDSAASWTGSSATLADEATIRLEGANSMKTTVAKNVTGTATKSTTLDLTAHTGGAASDDSDYIALAVRVDHPERLDFIQLTFSLGNTTFAQDTYTRIIVASNERKSKAAKGIASMPEVIDAEKEFIEAATGGELTPDETDSLVTKMSGAFLTFEKDTWVELRIPKRAFTRAGSSPGIDWADVQALKLTVKANSRGTVIVYFDDWKLLGGTGLQGRYRYHVTYFNEDTGSRSNPNETYVEVSDVQRSSIVLGSLPVPTDAQITHVEIWRTVGDGSFFFLVDRVAIASLASGFTDDVVDFVGMGGPDADSLQNVILPFDNTAPSSTFESCIGPHAGRMWWCNDTESGKGGRVYYSPAGRAEAVQGWIEVTSADDQTQGFAIWNGSLYCYAESGVYEVVGLDEPFIPRRVVGAPGTTQPDTIRVTPYGIPYQAHDSVRLFNGNVSDPLHHEPVARIMHGETVGGIAGFEGNIATYGRDEYVVSNGVVTLACDVREGRWREIGVAATGLFYEDDTGQIQVAMPNAIVTLEDIGEDDDGGTDISFDVQTSGILPKTSTFAVIDLLIIDLNTNGEQLTVVLDIDGTEYTLGIVETTGREKRGLTINRTGRIISMRITGTIDAIVEIFHAELFLSVGGKRIDPPYKLFDPNAPYVGLWSSYGSDIMPRFGLQRAKGVSAHRTQTIRSRPGSTLVVAT